MLVLDRSRQKTLSSYEEIFEEYSEVATNGNQHLSKGDLVLRKDTIIWRKCAICGDEKQVQYQTYLNKPEGVCLSCACIERSKNVDYVKSITRSGKDHWAYGLRGEDSTSFGAVFSDERKKAISNSKKRVLQNGITVAENASRKAVITKRNDGGYEKSAAKAAITKEKNNSWVVYRTQRYKGLYYRSSLERRFLEEQERLGRLLHFDNCDFSIPYIWNGKRHRYIPDFFDKKNNVLFEIKCRYTWDNKGKNKELLRRNKAKLIAAYEAGYGVRLVMYRQQVGGEYSEPEVYDKTQIEEMV